MTKPVDESDSDSEFGVELLDLDDEYETVEDPEECEDGEWVDAEDLGFTEPFEELKISVVSS